MSPSNPFRRTLSLTRLEDRCTPAILVTNTQWVAPTPNNPNPAPPVGSMQAAFATAAATPGQDEIEIDWASPQVGNTPTFTVLVGGSITVPEGVILKAGTGQVFAKFTGETPFDFTHTAAVGVTGTGKQSEIIGGVFDTCAVPNMNDDSGGAVVVSGGQVRTVNTRFAKNLGQWGGAIKVKKDATLILDGDPTKQNADPNSNTPFENTTSHTILRENKALSGGGAVDTWGTVILKRVWFVANEAGYGGAVQVFGGTTVSGAVWAGLVKTEAAPGTTADVRFYVNKATSQSYGGGAIRFDSPTTNTLNDAHFQGNSTAQGNGGALEVRDGTVKLFNCTLVANAAQTTGNGGAVAGGVFEDPGSTFKQNWSAASGGALWVKGGNVTLTVSTLDSNVAAFAPPGQQPVVGYGHGIYIEQKGAGSTSTVTATLVDFKTNGGLGGVAVHISTGGELKTFSCNFFNSNGIHRGRNAPGAPLGVYTPDPDPTHNERRMFNDEV